MSLDGADDGVEQDDFIGGRIQQAGQPDGAQTPEALLPV
jgi:hypothetical protein